jgi:hypothetical protein
MFLHTWELTNDFITFIQSIPSKRSVSSTAQLIRESTEPQTQRANGMLDADETATVWSLERLSRYLESYGLCNDADACATQLRGRINKACAIGLDMSKNHLRDNHVKGAFSLLHVRLWVDVDLNVMWHRTSTAVHELLLEKHPDVSDLSLEILRSAVRLVEHVQSEGGFLKELSNHGNIDGSQSSPRYFDNW